MKPSIFFVGTTNFSESVLEGLMNSGLVNLVGVMTGTSEFSISYSKTLVKNKNFNGLDKFRGDCPFLIFDKMKGHDWKYFDEQIRAVSPDVILIVGWYYMVPRHIRSIAKYGAWGVHASMLPKYAGGAPLVWAMIEGETSTGVTLFRMDDGVDDGDLIGQSSFEISDQDYISDVLKKAEDATIDVFKQVFSSYPDISFHPQEKEKIKVYPQRSPADGRIDLNKSRDEISCFIRAQSHPYPGAFVIVADRKLIIFSADPCEAPKNLKQVDEIYQSDSSYYLKSKDEKFLKVQNLRWETK